MWFEKKFKIQYILFFILLICLIVFVSYLYFYPEKKIISDNIIANPSDIEQWQTYTNEEFHYSIKYPPDWSVMEGGDESCYAPNDNAPCGKYATIFLYTPSKYTAPIGIQILYNKKYLSLYQALKERGWNVNKNCQPIEVNNIDGFNCNLDFLFSYKDFIYWLYWSDLPGDIYEPLVKELLQVIPYFKIADKISEQDILALENKVIEKIVSTFRILED